MRNLRITCATLGLLLATGLHSDAQAIDALGRTDQGWMLSLGFGMGQATMRFLDNEVADEFHEGVNTEWRVAKMLNPKLALGVEYNGWLLEAGDPSARLHEGLQSFGFSLSWYPGTPSNGWGGMFVRLGGGAAIASLGVSILSDDLQEVIAKDRLDEWGWSITTAAGYEFFVTDTVAIGPNVNFAYLSINELLAKEGHWLTISMVGTWYF